MLVYIADSIFCVLVNMSTLHGHTQEWYQFARSMFQTLEFATDIFSTFQYFHCVKPMYKVNKTFSKNVQGCRDGSAKNHSN